MGATPTCASPLSSPRLRARALSTMFFAAAAVGFFAAFFPAENARPPHIGGVSTIFFIPTISLATAILARYTAERWPDWLWLAVQLITNLLVGMAMYNAGTMPSGAEIFLMWTLVFAAFFLPTRHAVILGVEAGIVLAVAIAVGPTTVKPVTLWVMLMGSFVGVAGVVAALKHQLETAVRRHHDDAVTDPLTLLGNRRRLMDDLADLLTAPPAGAGIALFDLDGFKAFNDAFGHPEGDDLLIRLGRRLQAAVGTAGTAYRLGGDEFCVVINRPGPVALDVLVEHARGSLAEQGPGYAIGSSCGYLALAPGADLVETLREVDTRLYVDKRERAGARRRPVASVAR
ncbi:MAG: GGDEF domain-containing protein [Solirubrobacteraceae bacterium]|nr:GGDEF domain-containing protein [Solirubrobacteraceae bacterium]